MRLHPLLLTCALLSVVWASSFAHNSDSSHYTNGLDLLKRSSQHYADAKSYHIKAIEERSDSNELRRSWEKQLMEAAEDSNHRYHYEGHSGWGGALRVSDGTDIWSLHINQRLYTRTAVKDWDSNVHPG